MKLWLKRFFDLSCEYMPNKNTRHLLDNYTKTEVFKIYVASMAINREDGHASFTLFLKTWSTNFHNVRIPAVNRFSKCSQCLYYKTLRDKGTSIVEKGMFSTIHLVTSPHGAVLARCPLFGMSFVVFSSTFICFLSVAPGRRASTAPLVWNVLHSFFVRVVSFSLHHSWAPC